MGNFLCGVETVKRFVNAHLHCIVSLEKFLRMPMRRVIFQVMHFTSVWLFTEMSYILKTDDQGLEFRLWFRFRFG